MSTKKAIAIIEAILFAVGNSVPIDKLSEVLDVDIKKTKKILDEMKTQYEDEQRGIELIFLDDSVQLATKNETYDYLIKIAKTPPKFVLTDTVLETLSIIAYKQPVTRSEIEKIRGVSCDHAIAKLMEYDLIEDVGRLDAPGKPLLYGTTEQFLRSFGVKSIGDLPVISPELEADFRIQAGQEIYGDEKPEGIDSDADANADEEPINVEI